MRRTTAASFVPAARRRISDGVSSSREIFTVIAVSLNRATTDGSCRFEPFQITLESTQRPVGISLPGVACPKQEAPLQAGAGPHLEHGQLRLSQCQFERRGPALALRRCG
jgi:hypothetical protein